MQPGTIKTVEEAVLNFYLKNYEPLSVPEIITECKLSDTIIRKVVNQSPRLSQTNKSVAIMSKNNLVILPFNSGKG